MVSALDYTIHFANRFPLKFCISKSSFAFLEFETSEIADKNYNELQHKKINNKELYIDFVGDKSTYQKKERNDENKNTNKVVGKCVLVILSF